MIRLAIPRPTFLAGSANKAHCRVVVVFHQSRLESKFVLWYPSVSEIYYQYQGFYEPNKAIDQRGHGLKLHKLHMVVIVLYICKYLELLISTLNSLQHKRFNIITVSYYRNTKMWPAFTLDMDSTSTIGNNDLVWKDNEVSQLTRF